MEPFAFKTIKNKNGLSPIDKFYIYSFLSPSTYILSQYNTKIDFIKNVYNIALHPNSPFFYYGFDYLKRNLSEIGTFSSILHSIATGKNKMGDIANFLQLKSTYLTRYIQKLQDLMIIKKELPIAKTQVNSKYGRYYIQNNFLKFWFCYIYPNIMNLEIKKHQPVLKQLDDSIITNILTPAYINYMKSLITDDPEKYLQFIPTKIGSWWDNNGNMIDIVAYDNKQITFIKILWEAQDIATLKYSELKQMSDHFKTTLKRNYIIITKNTYLNSFNKKKET
jgi:AAA+ ATPase superfamily predicted ATPase